MWWAASSRLPHYHRSPHAPLHSVLYMVGLGQELIVIQNCPVLHPAAWHSPPPECQRPLRLCVPGAECLLCRPRPSVRAAGRSIIAHERDRREPVRAESTTHTHREAEHQHEQVEILAER